MHFGFAIGALFAYLAFVLLLVSLGGYVLGYAFRKGWDRAGQVVDRRSS